MYVWVNIHTCHSPLSDYHKGKGKGICLESRYPRYTCSSDFTFPLAVGAYGSLQLSIQPWICAPGTHYGWVDRGSVEYEVCPTLLHMASTGNRTPDLLILSPTPYPLGIRTSLILVTELVWFGFVLFNDI